jgi:hypothetical protein
MAVTAQRTTHIQFTGDIELADSFVASANVVSPGQVEVRQLASGPNTITPPSSGVNAVSCTIIPPAANIIDITLKGVTGDTGVVLHNTDPTTIALDSPTATFVLTAASLINGVRLIWT